MANRLIEAIQQRQASTSNGSLQGTLPPEASQAPQTSNRLIQQLQQTGASTTPQVQQPQAEIKSPYDVVPKTQEEFKKRYGKERGLNQTLIGAVKGAFNTLYESGELFEALASKISGQPKLTTQIAGKELEKPKVMEATTPGQKLGYGAEQIGEYFIPGTASLKVGKAAGAAVKVAPKLAELAARAGTEATLFGTQTAMQTGDLGEAVTASLLGGAFPVAGKVLGKVGKGIKATAKAAIGKSTGAGVATIEEAFKNPSVIKFAREAGAEGAEGLQRKAVEAGKEGLSRIAETARETYQKDLAKIKLNKTQLDDVASSLRTEAKSLISPERYNIKISPQKNAYGEKANAWDFSKSTITEGQGSVERALNDVMEWTDWTPAGMDLLKKRLAAFKSQTSYGTPARALVNDLWHGLRTKLEETVPGYREMTSKYSSYMDLVEEMEKTMSLGQKANYDTTVRKFMSIMRDNNELRKELATMLSKESGKDITGMMAGAQLAPIMPRGLQGTSIGLGTAGLGAFSIVNPATWPLTIAYLGASSPRLVGEFINLMGGAARGVNGLIEMTPLLREGLKRIFGDAEKTVKKEKGVIEKAISKKVTQFGEKTAPKLRKAMSGLSIEDVSGGKPSRSLTPKERSFKQGEIPTTKPAISNDMAKAKASGQSLEPQAVKGRTLTQADIIKTDPVINLKKVYKKKKK